MKMYVIDLNFEIELDPFAPNSRKIEAWRVLGRLFLKQMSKEENEISKYTEWSDELKSSKEHTLTVDSADRDKIKDLVLKDEDLTPGMQLGQLLVSSKGPLLKAIKEAEEIDIKKETARRRR